MAEGSRQAALAIAISYQALGRALQARRETLVSDCTVLILFAGIYVEASLNYILDQTGDTARVEAFFRPAHPGMHNKLPWFYNQFVAKTKAHTRQQLYRANIDAKLRRRFRGFGKLHRFRNDISHGEVNSSARSLAMSRRLRRQAKDLVDDLYAITRKAGYRMPRLRTYQDAIRFYRAR